MQTYTLPGYWIPNDEVVSFKVEAISVEMAIQLARADAQELWEQRGQSGVAQIKFCGVYEGDCQRIDLHTFLEEFN